MENYIPKIIHYCWFGKNKLPDSAKQYIESWKKYCPDYIIKEWNEDNFDVNSNKYVKEAYESKKFAFVTDYVRLYALYNEGGIYMDTDVEIIKPLDKFLTHHAFSSFESNNMIPTGLMAAEKGNPWIKDLLDDYNDISFINSNGEIDLTTNVVRITNKTVEKYGLIQKSSYQELCNGIVTLYPYDYFCPKDWQTGIINLTKNTCAIHHFSGTWLRREEQIKKNCKLKFINNYILKYGEELGLKKANSKFKYYFAFRHPIVTIRLLKRGK